MNVLEKAERIVNGDRQDAYGHPIEDFSRTANMWSQIIGAKVRPEQIPLCMIALKISRQVNKHKEDNLVDIAGYARTLELVHEKLEAESTPDLIYLASPYSHKDFRMREARFNAACSKAAEMMQEGKYVFSPIANSHPLSDHGLPGDWNYWEPYDRALLEKCSELVVLRLPGWKESVGVQAEIKIAEDLGKPVSYIDE